MGQQISLDTDAVRIAINQIGDLISEIDLANKNLVRSVESVNEATQNKYQVTVALHVKLQEQVEKFNQVKTSQADIVQITKRYADAVEQANDSDGL